MDEALKTFMQAFQMVSIMPDTFQSLEGVLTRRRDSSFSRRAWIENDRESAIEITGR